MNKERLMNVARALRESPDPSGFDMGAYYDDECGTPCCAFGHYVCREDLQNDFKREEHGYGFKSAMEADFFFGCEAIARHWIRDGKVTKEQFLCHNAESALEAAEWIERQVAALPTTDGEQQ